MNLTPIAANQTEVETKNARVFFSYRTPVAAYIFGEGFVKTYTWYSKTTTRHLNQWSGRDIVDTVKEVPQELLDNLV